MFNAIFRKEGVNKLKFEPGTMSCTDGKTIWVNMKDSGPMRTVVEELQQDDKKSTYILSCGHIVRAASFMVAGAQVDCVTCGTNDAYLSFEHEWQHIIFKTGFDAQALFIEEYTKSLKGMLLATNPNLPGFDQQYLDDLLKEFPQFLHDIINALDDTRCNSLWEKVYPGSASRIWARWKRLGEEVVEKHKAAGIDSFSARIICTGVGCTPNPDSKYACLDPYIQEALRRARYRGFPGLLVVVRWLMEHSINTLLNGFQPPQHPQGAPPPPAGQNGAPQGSGPPPPGSNQPQDPQEEQGDDGFSAVGDDEQNNQPQNGQPPPAPQPMAPPPLQQSLQGAGQDKNKLEQALKPLFSNSVHLDPKEEHHKPDITSTSPSSIATSATVSKALSVDLSDPQQDQALGDAAAQLDQDVQQAVQQLQDAQAEPDQDNYLVAGAKASLRFIDVMPSGITPGSRITLEPEERMVVQRVRASFFRAQGRKKAEREVDGVEIDIDALIQHRIEPTDGAVFQGENVNRGFCYKVLTDMSGSMRGEPFSQVCHATEMLKQSLNFPFVMGDLWGFRGSDSDAGMVWIYRYDPQCDGYQGMGFLRGGVGGPKQVSVCCGGLTPMHSAIHVAVKDLLTMPAGAVKRLFLLTDGSPMHGHAGGGGHINRGFLKKLVGQEIGYARQKGIQVYTIIIGDERSTDLPDEHCFFMFGQQRYWRRVTGEENNTVDKVLQKLVLDNFQRYLQAKG